MADILKEERRTRSESKSIIQHSALHSTTRRRRTRSESTSIIQHSALHSTTRRSETRSVMTAASDCLMEVGRINVLLCCSGSVASVKVPELAVR